MNKASSGHREATLDCTVTNESAVTKNVSYSIVCIFMLTGQCLREHACSMANQPSQQKLTVLVFPKHIQQMLPDPWKGKSHKANASCDTDNKLQ